jgi:cell division protease FtsH
MPPASRTPPATPPEPRSPLDLKPSNLWLLTLALVALFGVRDLWITSNQVEPIPYSEFLK